MAATDNVGVTGYGTYLGATSKGTTTATATTISGLVCGTSYTVGVDAADAAGNRSARGTLTATTASCPVDSQAPTAPANLTAANPTGSSLDLSWSASTDDTAVTGYRLSRDGDEVGTTTGTSYSFAGLGCGTAYSLGVEAYDAAGNTSIRSTVTASTTACPDTQAPSVPANLTQTGDTTSERHVRLGCSHRQRRRHGLRHLPRRDFEGHDTATTTTISGLVCGTSYTVGVDAADAAANRSAKATLTATTASCPVDSQAPTAPTNLAVSGTTANSLTLSWTAATDDTAVTGYTLYRDASQAGTTSGSTSYTFGSLACGSSYTLGVEALDAVGHVSTRSTLVASTASCGPTSTTFVDAADAYVSSTTNTNNGSQTTLKVKQSNPTETAYLKFNVSGLAGPRPERHPARLRQLRHRLGLRRLHHHLQLDRNRPQLHKRPRPHHQTRQLPLRQPHRLDQPRRHRRRHRQRHLQLRPRRHLLARNLARQPRNRRQRTPTAHHQKRHTPTTRHPTPNPTHQPHRHQHHHNRQPHLDRRHRQHRRHRLQPLPLDDGRVHARGGQPDRATDVDRLRGHGPGRRHLLLPRHRT